MIATPAFAGPTTLLRGMMTVMSGDVGTWQVVFRGTRGTLGLTDEGLVLSSSEGESRFGWADVNKFEFPTAYSAVLHTDEGEPLPFGFASTGHQRDFRTALDGRRSHAEEQGAVLPASNLIARESPIPLLTVQSVPGRTVTGVVGLVTASTVMSRNLFSDAGSEIKSLVGGRLKGIERAMDGGVHHVSRQLGESARRLGADAVIGVSFVITSVSQSAMSGSAEVILMSGTAVTTRPLPDAGS